MEKGKRSSLALVYFMVMRRIQRGRVGLKSRGTVRCLENGAVQAKDTA